MSTCKPRERIAMANRVTILAESATILIFPEAYSCVIPFVPLIRPSAENACDGYETNKTEIIHCKDFIGNRLAQLAGSSLDL